MKRSLVVAAITMFVATACAAPKTSDGAGAGITPTDSAAIVALDSRLATAGLAGNWDAWGAEFTSDPVRLPPNAPILVGKAAADAFNRSSPKFATFEVAVTSVIGRGDVAVATGTFKASVPVGKDATGKATPAINDVGKFMQVLMKQSDGGWKIARDIWNSDLPVPGPISPAKK